MSDDMKRFIRIASARIKSKYEFAPQRQAIAAKMYINWLERLGIYINVNQQSVPHVGAGVC